MESSSESEANSYATSDIDTEDEVFLSKIEEKTLLFDGSKLDINEFNHLFIATVEKLSIPDTHRDLILDLIRLSAPIINNVPESFRRIKNSLEKPDLIETLICSSCEQEIHKEKLIKGKKGRKTKNKKCLSDTCRSNRLGLKSNSIIKVYEANIFPQIEFIVREHLHTIDKYTGK